MAESEAAVDPRLVAIGLASEIVIEFPEGTIEVDMLDAPPAEPDPRPLPEPVMLDAAVEPEVPVVVRIEPAPAAEPLPESQTLLDAPIVHGLWPRQADVRVEELGMRITAPVPIGVRWTDVTAITVRGDRIHVRTKATTIRFAPAIDGVAAPEVNDAFARVLREAHEGQLDLQGSAVHELQNAADQVRDTFHSSDDTFTPVALGGALGALTVIVAFALPEILAFFTRPSVPPNAFVLGSRLAPFDPRVLLVAVAAAAVATALTARAALGPHSRSWARGTLRGWHIEPPSIVARLRRVLALVFLYPSIAAAALALALAVTVPSARSHATVDPRGIHVVRPVPLFDRTAAWTDVAEIVPLAASGPEHPHGLAVLLRFSDGGTVTTSDLNVRNSTDRYLLELARKWYEAATARR